MPSSDEGLDLSQRFARPEMGFHLLFHVQSKVSLTIDELGQLRFVRQSDTLGLLLRLRRILLAIFSLPVVRFGPGFAFTLGLGRLISLSAELRLMA
jgi:hypothetical protein